MQHWSEFFLTLCLISFSIGAICAILFHRQARAAILLSFGLAGLGAIAGLLFSLELSDFREALPRAWFCLPECRSST